MKKVILLLLMTLIAILAVRTVQARITPEDIINSKKEAYEARVKNYSPDNKQKLESLAKKIAQINKKRTDELDQIMITQAGILDQYEQRNPGNDEEAVEKARYWITYAHEAVAFQAAKIYVFNLTNEKNIKSDAKSLVNLFQTELISTRSKVINSKKMLKNLVKER